MGKDKTSRVRRRLAIFFGLIVWMLVPVSSRAVDRPDFKPGYNFYSPQDDAQLGKEWSASIDRRLPLLDAAAPLNYLNTLGKQLVAFAPNNRPEYAWQFRIVNSSDINAFALPGGYIYVNRGVFDAAQDEAQLAGVIAHESGHVVMRHGTHIASQTVVAQGGLAIIGGLLGQNGSLTSQLARLGLGLGVDSLLLKNSRSAETQADEVGTYVLYEAGYDPHAMAQFFQIIARKYPQRTLLFFSDHPNPENRIADVDREIAGLGPRVTRPDSPDFDATKRYLAGITPSPPAEATKNDAAKQPPPLPSANFVRYQGKAFSFEYPDNWQVQTNEGGMTICPQGGMVSSAEGDSAQAYGAAVSLYSPSQGNWGLVDATQELLDTMRQSNPQLQVLQQTGANLKGSPALSTLLQSDSPLPGQKETDHLVTVRRGDSVLTFIFIVPTPALAGYAPTFDRILESIELGH